MISILSDRGFLPNYLGLGGNIIAYVNEGYSAIWNKIDFKLNRTALIALCEYSPGENPLDVLVKIIGVFTLLKEKKVILKISTAKRIFYSTKL